MWENVFLKKKFSAVFEIQVDRKILDFEFDAREKYQNKFQSYVKLVDIETKEVFYDKLSLLYLEMPKFNKTEQELETHFDKWLYIIKNLHKLDEIPKKIQNSIFKKLFKQAEIAQYKPKNFMNDQETRKPTAPFPLPNMGYFL